MAEEMKKKDGRGGARPGAGRPKTDTKLYSFRAPGFMAREIDKAEKPSDYIRSCLALGMKQISENPLEFGTKELQRVAFDTTDEQNLVNYSETQIQCGLPNMAFNAETVPESLVSLLGINPDYMYMMTARGNSMIDAGIQSGDRLIIDARSRIPTPKQIAVCELNGEYTLKHFQMMDGYGLLKPENPDYDDIRVEPGDDFHIWGTLYMVFKCYK